MSKSKRTMQRTQEEDEDSLLQKFWKINFTPFNSCSLIFSSFLVCFEWFKTRCMCQVGLYKASLYFKSKDATTKKFKLDILIIYINSLRLFMTGVLGGGGRRGWWSSGRPVSVCNGGWTTTVSALARCTNQDLISTTHRSRPKGRNDSRIASLSHRTRGGYKNLPLPPPLPKERAVI